MCTRQYRGVVRVNVWLTLLLGAASPAWGGLRGDPNNSGSINPSDAVTITTWLQNGTPMACHNAADANADGSITSADVTYIYSWYYSSTPPVPHHIINCTGVEFPNDETGTIVQQGVPAAVSQPMLIINHASKFWDVGRHAKHAIDCQLTNFCNNPIIFIFDDHAADWYPKDHTPNKAFYSSNGAFTNATLQIDSNNVTVAGGYALECYRRAVLSVVHSYYANRSSGNLTINIPMDAVFTAQFADVYDWPLFLHSYQKAQAGESPYSNELTYLAQLWYAPGPGSAPAYLFGNSFCDPPGNLSMTAYQVKTYIDGLQKPTLSYGTGARFVHFKFWTSTTCVP